MGASKMNAAAVKEPTATKGRDQSGYRAGRDQVVANALEILERHCAGENVKAIHTTLTSNGKITVCYAVFARWMLEMQLGNLKVRGVPRKLRLRAILQKTDKNERQAYMDQARRLSADRHPELTPIPLTGKVAS